MIGKEEGEKGRKKKRKKEKQRRKKKKLGKVNRRTTPVSSPSVHPFHWVDQEIERERGRGRERVEVGDGGGAGKSSEPPPMVVSRLVAPLAGDDNHRDRSGDSKLTVVAARRMVATALSSRPAKNRGDKQCMSRRVMVWFLLF